MEAVCLVNRLSPHDNTAYAIFSIELLYTLATLPLSEQLSCVDFTSIIMGNVPAQGALASIRMKKQSLYLKAIIWLYRLWPKITTLQPNYNLGQRYLKVKGKYQVVIQIKPSETSGSQNL